ncbi:CKLF-like MARVEL transmembrane domain-containing protein 4, partial [Biomphalaria pfeifferi]
EFIEYCISDGLLIMSAIVSAIGAPIHPGIAAAAVFNFLALAVFGVDTYYMFKAWQEHKRQLVGAAVVTDVITTTTITPTK